jgi:hypothetical protein
MKISEKVGALKGGDEGRSLEDTYDDVLDEVEDE